MSRDLTSNNGKSMVSSSSPLRSHNLTLHQADETRTRFDLSVLSLNLLLQTNPPTSRDPSQSKRQIKHEGSQLARPREIQHLTSISNFPHIPSLFIVRSSLNYPLSPLHSPLSHQDSTQLNSTQPSQSFIPKHNRQSTNKHTTPSHNKFPVFFVFFFFFFSMQSINGWADGWIVR